MSLDTHKSLESNSDTNNTRYIYVFTFFSADSNLFHIVLTKLVSFYNQLTLLVLYVTSTR